MKIKTSISIEQTTLLKLKKIAVKERRSVSNLVNQWVEEAFLDGKKRLVPTSVSKREAVSA